MDNKILLAFCLRQCTFEGLLSISELLSTHAPAFAIGGGIVRRELLRDIELVAESC